MMAALITTVVYRLLYDVSDNTFKFMLIDRIFLWIKMSRLNASKISFLSQKIFRNRTNPLYMELLGDWHAKVDFNNSIFDEALNIFITWKSAFPRKLSFYQIQLDAARLEKEIQTSKLIQSFISNMNDTFRPKAKLRKMDKEWMNEHHLYVDFSDPTTFDLFAHHFVKGKPCLPNKRFVDSTFSTTHQQHQSMEQVSTIEHQTPHRFDDSPFLEQYRSSLSPQTNLSDTELHHPSFGNSPTSHIQFMDSGDTITTKYKSRAKMSIQNLLI